MEKPESPQPATDGRPGDERVGPASVDDRPVDSQSDDCVLVTEDHRAGYGSDESTISLKKWLEAMEEVGELTAEEVAAELDAGSSPLHDAWKLVDEFYACLEMVAEPLCTF